MFGCFKDKVFLNKFFKVAVPVMISAFISFLVNFLDNIMVGTVSNEAVSGVYAANQVTYLVGMAFFGILEGAGIFIEQFNGAKDEEHIRQCFRYKLIADVLLALVVFPVVYLFGPYLISAYCQSDSNYELILAEGKRYLYIVMLSYIPFIFSDVYEFTLREIGETSYAMIASIIAIVTNAVFNLIFIIFLKMGAPGAAIATIISRVFELLYCVIACKVKKFGFQVNTFKNFKIEKILAKRITSKSIPLFINEMGFAVGVMLQNLAFSQRDGVLSAISIVATVSNILGILISGISVAVGVIVGSDLGANEFENARKDNRNIILLGTYISLFLGLLVASLNRVIPLLYSEVDAAQKELASSMLVVYGFLCFANSIAVTSYYTLRVGGQSKLIIIFDSGFMFFLYIPISWTLALATSLPMLYIYLIVRFIDVIKAITGIIFIRRYKWLNNLTLLEGK